MPILLIPFVRNRFAVTLELSKYGGKKAIEVPGIIDTGATDTCISLSHVMHLDISPDSQFSASATASGQLFSRHYPVRIGINKQLYRLARGLVLFRPDHFLTATSPAKVLQDNELRDICSKNGITSPEAYITIASPSADGNGMNELKIFRPGLGLEQGDALIGMDILSQYDWHFSKDKKSLVIEY